MKIKSVVSIIFAISVMFHKPANAASVLVDSGRKGQGYAFVFDHPDGKRCYVITAAHVVGDVGQTVKLTDELGNIVEGEVTQRNSQLDLALIGGMNARVPVCQVTARPLASARPLADARSPKLNSISVDIVASSAGGLIREEIANYFTYEDGHIVVELVNKETISQGDSGAPVWIGQYTLAKEDSRNSRPTITGQYGIMIGVLSRITEEKLIIIPSEQVLEFFYNTLSPHDIDKIKIHPRQARVLERYRGDIYWPSRFSRREHFLSSSGLDKVSFVIDVNGGVKVGHCSVGILPSRAV